MTDLATAVEVTPADLERWYAMQDELRKLKAAESMLRGRIYAQFFPTAKEGTNDYPLEDGTNAVLKAKRVIDRKVLEPELDAYKTASAEDGSNMPQLPWAKLIRYKPELVTSEYRKLTAEEQAACDLVLQVKDGSPQLEIVVPKRAYRS